MKTIKELYEYRTMISSLVVRDLRGRYKGSVLGFAWTLINPLLQLIVYTFVFSTIMRAGIEDYYLFLFVALIPWIMFSSSVTGGASCILSQKSLVSKIYFPREVIPISHVTTQLVNMLLSMIVVFVVVLFSGKGVNIEALLFLPLVIIVEYILAVAIALIVSAVTVYFRDFEHIMGILVFAWQFLTPVMYSTDMVPEKLMSIYNLNPMTPIIVSYRDILYYKKCPDAKMLIVGLGFSVILLIIGWFVFGKLKKHFAEEI